MSTYGRPDRSRDETGVVGFGDRSTGRGNIRANMRRPIVTNGGPFTIGNSHIAAQRGCCLVNS